LLFFQQQHATMRKYIIAIVFTFLSFALNAQRQIASLNGTWLFALALYRHVLIACKGLVTLNRL
jgi:hypothetical protein